MSLADHIRTTIQAGTVNPARAGFGVPLFMDYHTAWADDEVRSYTGFAGVSADFASHTLPYKWAAAVFAQSPRPAKIKIGRMAAPATGHVTVLDFADLVTGTSIAGSITSPLGVVTPIAITWTTNLATTLALLETAIEAVTGIASATVVSSAVTVLGNVGAGQFHFSFSTAGCHIRDTTADWDYDDALTAAVLRDADFYAVTVGCNSPKNMDKVARWALANDRIAFFAPQYTKPAQFVSGEFSAGADYTALLANDAAVGLFTTNPRTAFAEAAWLGGMLPRDPGSATWKFKRLAGVGADAYTATHKTQIEAVKGNHYTVTNAIGFTSKGTTFGGEWIDVVIGLAWLEARLAERILALFLNNPKIAYTDAGLALIVAEVRAQLKEAVDRDVLDASWTVTVTPVAQQATADRAARIVRGVEFQARLAGAVHEVDLTGTVTA